MQQRVPQVDYEVIMDKIRRQVDGVLASGLTATQAARVRSMLRDRDWELTASDARHRLACYRLPGAAGDKYGVKVQGYDDANRHAPPDYDVVGSHGYIEASQ